ncbi:MAG: hypothetical protein P1V18_02220 [Candidatus Gracilibacteria bacterium]|nr:hypothetical protein [Candidatus Gracilibacteria bacterium]
MAVAAIRRENESSEKIISRWKKKAQSARVQNAFKRQRYFDKARKKPSKTKTKMIALKREHYRGIRKKLKHY